MRRVLVVDDDRYLREVLQFALADEGYEVEVAGDGREALRRLEAEPPHLVVLDRVMPGLDGVAVAAELDRRGLRPAIPLLLLSAAIGPFWPGQVQADAELAKPFDLDVLLGLVARLTRASCRPLAAPGPA